MATTITDNMCIAAAKELAKVAEDKGLTAEYIIPNMEEWEVFPREAAADGVQAVKDGIARVNRSFDDLLESAYDIIGRARKETGLKMENDIIRSAPDNTLL